MKKTCISIFSLSIVVFIFFIYGHDPNALWEILQSQCKGNMEDLRLPKPCLFIPPSANFAIMKDRKGSDHYLLIPLKKMSGIEDENATSAHSLLMWHSWQFAQQLLPGERDGGMRSIAINSAHGRSQNQYHIHMSCIRKEYYDKITSLHSKLLDYWSEFPDKINNHEYIWIKFHNLYSINPILTLKSYVEKNGDSIYNYGLIIIKFKGSFVGLASRYSLLSLNFGSVEELQDHSCSYYKRVIAAINS